MVYLKKKKNLIFFCCWFVAVWMAGSFSVGFRTEGTRHSLREVRHVFFFLNPPLLLVLKHGYWCFFLLIHYRGFRYHEEYWRSHPVPALHQYSTQRRQGVNFNPSNRQFSRTVCMLDISLYSFPWFFSQKTSCIHQKDPTLSSSSQTLGLPKRRRHLIRWPPHVTLPITSVRFMVSKISH